MSRDDKEMKRKQNEEKTTEEILAESMAEIENLLKENVETMKDEATEKEKAPESEADDACEEKGEEDESSLEEKEDSSEEVSEEDAASEDSEEDSGEESEKDKEDEDSEDDGSEDAQEDKTAGEESDEDADGDIIYLDDEDDGDGSEDEEEEEPVKKGKAGKILLIILGCVLGLVLLAYLGLALFFNSHFYYQTTLNDMDVSWKSVEQVEEMFRQKVAEYELTLVTSDGNDEVIKGSDIALAYKGDGEVERVLKTQNPFLWPKAFWDSETLQAKVGVEYDSAALTSVLAGLNCAQDEGKTDPISATPVFKDTQFEVQEEILGTKLDHEKFKAAVSEAISEFLPELNMTEAGCYLLPPYLSDSAEVIAAKDTMNEYLKATITYDFTPKTEVVDASVISTWLSVDENMQVVFDHDKVAEYVKGLAETYDTAGKTRSFVTAKGNTVEVKGGGYGWKINQKAEVEKLIANIEAHEVVTREPEYTSRAVSHEGNDFGNTYAEVDLSNQHMYFFQDGKLMMDSPVVTGNTSKGHGTPQGTYSVTYTTRNAVLKGRLLPDGTREYESPVKYWMPFNGGIGFHDASWRSTFGGSIYKTNGSHGCVNMPTSKAKELYGYLKKGMPVICHY